jgi:predicted nucleotidyltransferase
MASLSDIQALADKIASEFHPDKIILFGSHARGDARPDSDVDLMVIINSDEHPSRTAAEITYRVHPRRYPLDLIVRGPQTVRTRLQMNDWFLRDVMREGRILYAETAMQSKR